MKRRKSDSQYKDFVEKVIRSDSRGRRRQRRAARVKQFRGDDEFEKLLRQRRTNRIEQFKTAQRETREWINFAEIAEWCSKEGSILPSQEKTIAAYDTLSRDLLAGEFEEDGRSRILFFHPWLPKGRMSRERLRDIVEHNYDAQKGRTSFLPFCWMPRELFERWLAKHRLAESLPGYFMPLGNSPRVPRPETRREPSLSVDPESASCNHRSVQRRPLTEKSAERLARQYIDNEEQAGRIPSAEGLVMFSHDQGYYGGREYLRAWFREIRGEVRRGRPRKSPSKFAKK
jgi:hypothetical protein